MMNRLDANEVSERLAERAEAFCRTYLSAGRKDGRYWRVGDVRNTPGQSTYVRLQGPASGKGAAGKWTDAASGEHGNLLDIIREACGLEDFRSVLAEASRFLSLPDPPALPSSPRHRPRTDEESRVSARRLVAASLPLAGSLAETYLHSRALSCPAESGVLRFHPRCYYRADAEARVQTFGAMVATVTDLDDQVTGAHRTWLSRDGRNKAPVADPRKAMGEILGHAVRFGKALDVLAAGEGIETVLSVREIAPGLPVAAALSAAHLAAMAFPEALRRLYVVRDNDPAGEAAHSALVQRCHSAGIDCIALSSHRNDFNDDLVRLGAGAVRQRLIDQMTKADLARFLPA